MHTNPFIGAFAVVFVSAGTLYWMYSTGRLRRLLTRKKALQDGIMTEGNGRSIRNGMWSKVRRGGGGAYSETGSTISALTGYNSTLKDDGGSCDENSEGWSSIDSRSECTSHNGGGGGAEPNLRSHVDDDDPRR